MRTPSPQSDFELMTARFESAAKIEAEQGFYKLSGLDQIVFCVWWVEGEVNNGGFDQFFFNPAGDHAKATVASLMAIDAPNAADIVRRAIAVFPSPGPSPIMLARRRQLLALPEGSRAQFHFLDKEFYKYPDAIGCLLATYIRRHSD